MRRRKTKRLFVLLSVFAISLFLCGGFFLLTVQAESKYEYVQSTATTFTDGDTVLLTHEYHGVVYAVKNEGKLAVPQEITVSDGKVVSAVSDAMLWRVEFYYKMVRFRCVSNGNYLTINDAEAVCVQANASSGAANFENSTKLKSNGFYLKYDNVYTGNTLAARGITFTIYKQTEILLGAATVSFSAGEGTGEMASVSVSIGESFALPSCAFTKIDGEFTHWTDGEKNYEVGDTVLVDEDVCFTAVFEPNYYEVRFHDGDTIYATKRVLKTKSQAALSELAVEAPVKKGWVFVGWKLAESVLLENQLFSVSGEVDLYAYYTVGRAYSASVSLDGDIALNFYMELDEATLQNEQAKMTFTFKGEKREMPLSEGIPYLIDGNAYYKFTFPTAAKDYATPVTLAVSMPNAEGTEYAYSVKDYGERLLSTTDEKYSGDRAMVREMLSYCIAASNYFYGGSMSGEVTVSLSALEGYKPVTDGMENEGVTVTGATLLVRTVATIRIYFETEQSVVCKVDGNRVTAKAVGEEAPNLYYVGIDDIAAKDLDRAYTVEIGSYKIVYSALSYVYTALKGDNPIELQLLAQALYYYNRAANEYFER